MYVDEILDRQLDNGGWSLTARGGDGDADADITAMALQALAKYQDQRQVKNAVEDGVICLSRMQDREGGYSSWGVGNCESCAQVIVALCELGIDLENSRFVKNGNTLLDNLLSFRQRDGSFLHTADCSGDTQMASEEGFYAIAAALRSVRGESSLYRMTDAVPAAQPDKAPAASASSGNGLAGKDPAVQKTSVTAPGTTFPDIIGHANQTASALMWANEVNWKIILAYYITGFPMDCVQAAATWLFLWFAAEPMLEKLDRVKTKYGLVE